jgi:hypothetical protein
VFIFPRATFSFSQSLIFFPAALKSLLSPPTAWTRPPNHLLSPWPSSFAAIFSYTKSPFSNSCHKCSFHSINTQFWTSIRSIVYFLILKTSISFTVNIWAPVKKYSKSVSFVYTRLLQWVSILIELWQTNENHARSFSMESSPIHLCIMTWSNARHWLHLYSICGDMLWDSVHGEEEDDSMKMLTSLTAHCDAV